MRMACHQTASKQYETGTTIFVAINNQIIDADKVQAEREARLRGETPSMDDVNWSYRVSSVLDSKEPICKIFEKEGSEEGVGIIIPREYLPIIKKMFLEVK